MDSEPSSLGLTLMIVSGASRGLGAAICEEGAARMEGGSLIVGIARSLDGLKCTEKKVERQGRSAVKFFPVSLDLGEISAAPVEELLRPALEGASTTDFARVVLVHNAGTLDALIHLRNMDHFDTVQQYYGLNVSSPIVLNAVCMKLVNELFPKAKVNVVNISSLCAIEPFKTWALYCSAKAARDMVFRVLAAEEPQVGVLNYSPGPLDNDMQKKGREETTDDALRVFLASLKTDDQLLSCETSAKKLLALLVKGDYKSGAHVDFYDDV